MATKHCSFVFVLMEVLLVLAYGNESDPFVPITVLWGAVKKGAVCLDGSPPAYNFVRGYGSGANNWVISLEGGGWCTDIESCTRRAKSGMGSSLYMGEKEAFSGILSNRESRNPDFYNWNRVVVRYCDGSSFTGDVEEPLENSTIPLYFRGQRIWQAVMEELLSKGMDNAQQALLTGCSAGGLATIIHCDQFRDLLPRSSKVKCINDVGGGNSVRSLFKNLSAVQGSVKHLPVACTVGMDDPSQCFFPQNLLRSIATPLFILNAAYDSWQIRNILVPVGADHNNKWQLCRNNIANCHSWQLNVMEGYRDKMLHALEVVQSSTWGGMYINSCYQHCQTNLQNLWNSIDSPKLKSKTIGEAIGEWFFDRHVVKYIDCPYPCDSTCINRNFTS
ncbi:pectin acetylesterase 8 isoform X2 [Cryptomeria japonica]|uniref:pectin acetylesterase 8 isoform X2 n=1 Tax=Cryptomeria japonica TaxID=3369 RepID=UPI0027DA6C33|nr:pectin acetylesterase 8 isoform X2 [Cryptomeria japonica]